ncbi:MAG: DnaJ domain-containing protein [Lachnospiraceae bacterium]|nr:DnaJ domain-containing protein [Lachnospiraceae bacterium]
MKYTNPKDALLQLGITGPATLDDVKTAYRELLKIYHPDAHPDPELAWQYYDIADAYNFLLTCYEDLPDGARLPEQAVRGRVIGDTQGARAVKDRTAWRKKSQKSEEKRRQEMLSALEERRKEALFQETMDRIHAARAAELSAQIISAVLRGDKKTDE